VADHSHRAGTCRTVIVRGDGPAEDRPDAQKGKVVAGDELHRSGSERLGVCRERHVRDDARPDDAIEDFVSIAHLLEAPVGEGSADREQLLGTLDRQRAQHHGVDKAEDGRVRADAEGQRQQRHGGEGRIAREGAQGISNVPDERIEPGDDPGVARVFGHERRVTHLAPRVQDRRLPAAPELFLVPHQHVPMKIELPCEILVDAAAPHQVAQLVAQACPHGVSRSA